MKVPSSRHACCAALAIATCAFPNAIEAAIRAPTNNELARQERGDGFVLAAGDAALCGVGIGGGISH